MEDKLQDWTEWQAAVMIRMHEIGEVRGSGGALIDAKVPYEMGWTPDRAARALLYLDRKDYFRLLEITFGERCLVTRRERNKL